MSISSRLIQRAIKLYKAGNRLDAQRILKTVLRDDPQNQTAWNWYIETLPTSQERIRSLEEYLLINPEDRQALRALARLKHQQDEREAASKQPTSPSTEPEVKVQSVPPLPLTPQPSEPIVVSKLQSSRNVLFSRAVAIFSILLSVVLLVYLIKLQEQHHWLQGLYANLQNRYLSLQIAHEVVQQEKTQLTNQLDDLQLDYETLNTNHQELIKNYTSLEGKFSGLQLSYINLDSQYDNLLNDYDALKKNLADLKTEYTRLNADVETLKTNYTNLYGWYSWLQNNAVTPPYIAIHNRQLTLGFYAPDGSVQTWTKDVAELEQAIITGERNRNNPAYVFLDVNGIKVSQENYASYVDPNAFKDFIPSLYVASGSDYAFIQNVRRIISQLAIYNTENYEIPRHPLETFLMGGGDCEDISILLASMLLAAPVDWEIRLVFVDADHPQAAQAINHVIVYVDTGRDKYLLEPTDPEFFWSFDTQGWSLDVSQ